MRWAAGWTLDSTRQQGICQLAVTSPYSGIQISPHRSINQEILLLMCLPGQVQLTKLWNL